MVNGTKVRKNTECVVIVRTKNIMIIHAKYKTMILKEISDSLIHTAPRSVSLVHHNFRNDGEVIPQPLAHAAKQVKQNEQAQERAS